LEDRMFDPIEEHMRDRYFGHRPPRPIPYPRLMADYLRWAFRLSRAKRVVRCLLAWWRR